MISRTDDFIYFGIRFASVIQLWHNSQYGTTTRKAFDVGSLLSRSRADVSFVIRDSGRDAVVHPARTLCARAHRYSKF